MIVALVGLTASLVEGDWVALDLPHVGILALASILLFGAYHLSVVALRRGEVSLVGPFRYAIIIWSLLMGFFVWGDVPELVVLNEIDFARGSILCRSDSRCRLRRGMLYC
jgi:drug/metabolite transporter (DMT)-like permease